MTTPKKRTLGVLLYDGFELLDVYGPLGVFVHAPGVEAIMVARGAGCVASAQGPAGCADASWDTCPKLDLLLVPGGLGTRQLVDDVSTQEWLITRAADAELTMSVCTGSALLARAGLLNGRRATTNKRAFDWVASQGPKVLWQRRARWVDDGDIVTASGVSAGIDMAGHVVSRLFGRETAETIMKGIEYAWSADAPADDDPFALDP